MGFSEGPTPLERLGELFTKVEAFFERAKAKHGEAITCHAGGDDCCRRRFSVTALEAEILRERLAALSEEERRALDERARRTSPDAPCPALGEDGRCALYEARPLVCRTHGLPIRFVEARVGARSLPVVDACPKNFSNRDLATLDPRDVLDQTTLSTVLAALDAAFADGTGRPRGERIEMAELCLIPGVASREDPAR